VARGADPMSQYRKPLALLLTWAVVVLVANRLAFSPRLWFDPAVLAYVLVVPLLVGLAAVGPRDLVWTLRDALGPDPDELPAARRAQAAATLAALSGASVAAGVLGFFGMLINTFNAIAMSGGLAQPSQLLSGVPAMTLAPVYGLALKAFLFDPLAEGLEAAEPGLGAELE